MFHKQDPDLIDKHADHNICCYPSRRYQEFIINYYELLGVRDAMKPHS